MEQLGNILLRIFRQLSRFTPSGYISVLELSKTNNFINMTDPIPSELSMVGLSPLLAT